MTLLELFHALLKTYWSLFQFDIWFYSQWWTYCIFLIPAFFYTIFFFVKWCVLLAPLYIGPVFILQSLAYLILVLNHKRRSK